MWGLESKRFGSVLLLKFEEGTRDAFHTHAFNSVSWLLCGGLHETFYDDWRLFIRYRPSLRPIRTYRSTFHKVAGRGKRSWVITFRGPWADRWRESLPDRDIVLTHGRKEVA
jgi:hypothetical protein